METEKNNIKQTKVVETLAGDMAKVIEDGGGGVIKQIIHSEEANDKEKSILSPESKKNQVFMLIGVFFILASLATLAYFLFKEEYPTVPAQMQYTPIIFADRSTLLEVAGLKKDPIAKKTLDQINATTVKVGGVEAVYLTVDKSIIGLRQFIDMINSSLVLGSVDFVSDNFLMGVVNNRIRPSEGDGSILPVVSPAPSLPPSILRKEPEAPTDKNFFIIIKMRAVADIFEPLHSWENKMFSDLHGFIGVEFSPETKYLLTKNFDDAIVENKNGRVLYDKDNKAVLMYVLADDNSVIITDSEDAVKELITRLAASKVKK